MGRCGMWREAFLDSTVLSITIITTIEVASLIVLTLLYSDSLGQHTVLSPDVCVCVCVSARPEAEARRLPLLLSTMPFETGSF